MKLIFKWLGVAAMAMALFACAQKPEEPTVIDHGKDNPSKDPGSSTEVTVPDKQEVNLTVGPMGSEELTTKIEAYADWTVSPEEDYNWVSVTPASGSKGKNELKFVVLPNDKSKEREACFLVYQGKDLIYEIYVVQSKPEANVLEGDLAFLKAVVDGKLLGDATPEIKDWFVLSDEDISAFTGITFETFDGKWSIVQIGESAQFTAFPAELKLVNLERLRQNGNALLAGTEIPQVWSTPKLRHIALSHTKMTGAIPQGLADSPLLAEIYFDDTDFYGALPHVWASKVLEVALIGSIPNGTFTGEDPYEDDHECPYLGYIVPASLDVILNSQRTAQGDCTQMKLGGVREGHWLGFEKGWGQVRYEMFDPEAVAGNTEVWSIWRLLVGSADKDPDVWAHYYSNMGYNDENMRTYIPRKMLDWDQSVADAFTAAAKAAHDAKIPIDMTEFGGEVKEKHEDSIAGGEVITPTDFWAEQ